MTLKYVWIFPTLTFSLSALAFIISTTIALNNDHVGEIPFISDTGAQPPESCYFGLLLNLSALCMAISVYLRHRQIIEFYWHGYQQQGRWRTASTIILWFGYLSAFGMALVANFQETVVISVHYFGAFLTFTCGLAYIWAQTIFSKSMYPRLTNTYVCYLRFALSILVTLCYPLGMYCVLIARPPEGTTGIYKWSSEDKHFVERKIAAVCEWTMAICFEFYVLTFAIELRGAVCHAPKLKVGQHRSISTISTISESISTASKHEANIV